MSKLDLKFVLPIFREKNCYNHRSPIKYSHGFKLQG